MPGAPLPDPAPHRGLGACRAGGRPGPQPGVALLALSEGRVEAAATSIRAALVAEVRDRLVRARLCVAQVEISLAAGDVATARKAAAELDETASAYSSPGLSAAAVAQTAGAVLLAEDHAGEALAVLREACRRWLEFAVPYDCARTNSARYPTPPHPAAGLIARHLPAG